MTPGCPRDIRPKNFLFGLIFRSCVALLVVEALDLTDLPEAAVAAVVDAKLQAGLASVCCKAPADLSKAVVEALVFICLIQVILLKQS